MPNIGLIDDRSGLRSTMALRIRRILEDNGHDGWGVIESDPLPDVEAYLPWLNDNEIGVLVTDQRLNEVPSESTGRAVAYEGHQVIAYIRHYRPRLPIYVVTSFNDDAGLSAERDKYEFAVEREHFRRERAKLVPVMIRNGTQFLEQHAQQLEELATLSSKAATGAATAEDLNRIGALQLAVKHEYGFPEAAMKSDFLDDFERSLAALEGLIENLKNQLDEAESE